MAKNIINIVLLAIFLSSCTPNNTLTGSATLSLATQDSYLQDTGNLSLYFCPHEPCEEAFITFLNSAQSSLDCALYDIKLESIQKTLDEKSKTLPLRIVTDDTNLKKYPRSFVKPDKAGLMHNKFCIVDHKSISTGSMNPTFNDAHLNNNNLLIINSPLLAQNYDQEFQEMWNGTFKRGTPVPNPKIILQTNQPQNPQIKLENYFCPEDHCALHTKQELSKAQSSIYFMTFSFTHPDIANAILIKNLNNLENPSNFQIKGIMETKEITKDSVYQTFINNNLTVIKDKNPHNLHHKVFIIDNQTIVTGSFNPTGGGDTRNDENILIIHNQIIAQQYLQEFNYLWKNWSNETKPIEETANLEMEEETT